MNEPVWIRRKFFDSYGSRPVEQDAGMPAIGIGFSCPCCGYPTLHAREAYGICFLCSWEDDGQDDQHADEIRGGPNHGYSLSEARSNFEHHLVMYSPGRDTRIGGPDSEQARQIKREIIDAFDQMLTEPSSAELRSHWKTVLLGKRSLEKELKEKLRPFTLRKT